MNNSDLASSSSPSNRRHKEDDRPRQNASRTSSLVLSERTVLTATGSTKRSPSPSHRLEQLQTAQSSDPARQYPPYSIPNNPDSDYPFAQTQTAQISQSDVSADERSRLVHQPQKHESNDSRVGTLTRSPSKRWFSLCGDILLSLTPLFFLVLASLSLHLNHQTKSAFGDKVRAMTSLSPTIFPIIYAAILGTVLRRIGLYKAERSATVGTIERLIGCHSLFTTFETQIGLRRLDLLGVSLLLVWMLSPLGGQASLRLLTTTPRTLDFNSTLLYYPIEAYSAAPMILGSSDSSVYWPFYASPYMTALQTSEQTINSSMDL
ncbi:hypothetical protein C7974DRAFT_210334 [Boeremia exigua]|uniref:uncharacterized protein n=1 Tax=Boeremia exigua TaxID=749465 RepID=UPI001E8EB04A|nr:uncharacterized protein C7974DRAFT_210334 [Boeremia exigua]KAH6621748.1 hypothetical protein C7974DRAFT_210334 [Boeremia exigua]